MREETLTATNCLSENNGLKAPVTTKSGAFFVNFTRQYPMLAIGYILDNHISIFHADKSLLR